MLPFLLKKSRVPFPLRARRKYLKPTHSSHFTRGALGAFAMGAVAGGAMAIGALSIGALSIGGLFTGWARIGELRIGRLIVEESLNPASPAL
jgi:hypothetical protein